jgi:ABC-type glycerol-3-phosphate transport system substrate-binding protein
MVFSRRGLSATSPYNLYFPLSIRNIALIARIFLRLPYDLFENSTQLMTNRQNCVECFRPIERRIVMARRYLIVAAVMVLAFASSHIGAQENQVLTLSVPQWVGDGFNDAYFAPFLEANPGVNVVIVPDTEGIAYPASAAYSSLDEHLEGVAKYVSAADVLYTTTWTVSPESTQAGLWLDLQPLVGVDPDLNEANFYPPAWRAFRWDGGMWSLPTILTPQVLVYSPPAFDEAGLTYPDANWSMDQYVDAALKLTQRDDDGNATQPGCWCNFNLMIYGLLGHSLADGNGAPMLEDPQLAELVDKWAVVQSQIYPEGGYSSEGVALLMQEPWMLSSDMPNQQPYTLGEMPGNVYGATIYGFGISPATPNPELAFELVKFLTQNPINSYGGFGTFPALRDAETQTPTGYNMTSLDELPPEQRQVLEQAAETALVGPDMAYFEYVNSAMGQMSEKQIDAVTALQEAQAKALQNRADAAAWTGATSVVVATAVPTPSFDSSEIVLKFGLSQWSVPNQQDWDRLAREFAENDPQVGVVEVNRSGNDYETWQNENDCFYLTYDPISTYAQSDYLSLDPLLNADPAFNPADLVPGALEALQQNGQTYGYPFSLTISALGYNPEQFEKANVPLPKLRWTVNEFTDALQQLAQYEDGDYQVAFAPRTFEDTDWLLLLAAYGAMPIDYRTDPPTYQFTEPTTVATIQQVLDLAKNGLVDYQQMGTFSYTGMQKTGALFATSLTGNENYQLSENIALVSYPQGTQFGVSAVGSVGGGFISSDTPNIDACYRWISFIAAHPELLVQVMPARVSAIEDPVTLATQGESAVALYRDYVALATDPNTLNIPGNFGSTFEDYFVHQFLARAFDAYVLEDADLQQALTDAQRQTDEFLACSKNAPPVGDGSSDEDWQANSEAIEACIAQVAPDIAAEREAMMQQFE